jgi:hypothetical protein
MQNTVTVLSPVIGKISANKDLLGVTLASLSSTISSNPGLNATSYTFRARLTEVTMDHYQRTTPFNRQVDSW